jgi:hypothetical protein
VLHEAKHDGWREQLDGHDDDAIILSKSGKVAASGRT